MENISCKSGMTKVPLSIGMTIENLNSTHGSRLKASTMISPNTVMKYIVVYQEPRYLSKAVQIVYTEKKYKMALIDENKFVRVAKNFSLARNGN
jgi:hypothetical protein